MLISTVHISSCFFGLIYTPHTFWVPKPDQYLCFHVSIHNPVWCKQWTWHWWLLCVCAFTAIGTHFIAFFALDSTHIILEVPNLISTFVLMLETIFLSFVDWWCGWRMFCTCEYENYSCIHIHGNRYKFHSFLALNSTKINSKVPNLISTFVLISVFII